MKIVITGGPCSGKTTIINALRKKGYFTSGETAREIIVERKYSKHLDGYKDEKLHLQQDIFCAQMKKEKDLDKADDIYPHPVFLDRGYIDNQAYCKLLLGYIPEEICKTNRKRYEAVFILERLPMIDDNLRRETEQEAEQIHQEIIQAYRNNGYNPIIIPVTSIKERLNTIIEIVNSLEQKKEYSLIYEKTFAEV